MLRYYFLLIVCISLFKTAVAQKAIAVYYLKTSGYKVSTLKDADYLVAIMPPDTNVDKDLFIVKEFYLDGAIRYIGNAKTTELQVLYPNLSGFYRPALQGACIFFFPGGRKMKICNYDNGEQIGEETAYYPNGKLYCTKTYTPDKKLLCNECLDSTGKVLVENGNGKWLTFIDERFKNYVEGQVINGLEEGEWLGKQGDTANIISEYKNGALKSTAIVEKSGELTYTVLEKVPEFKGGLNGFVQFLGRNIKYPGEARERDMQGRVIISFVVEKNGALTDLKVVKSVERGIDEEALRVLRLCPPWKPGIQNGQPVRVAYSVPINFSLGEK